MLVAEKWIGHSRKKVSLAWQQQTNGEQGKPGSVHQLTDARETYDASGDGTPVAVPALSAEASQPTPFLSLSRDHWQEIRVQVARCLENFVSAAEEQRPDKVLSVGMEMQEIVSRIYLEAYVMSANLERKDLPR